MRVILDFSAGKFTMQFGPRERRIQLLSLASKVNALVIPGGCRRGGGILGFQMTVALLHKIECNIIIFNSLYYSTF